MRIGFIAVKGGQGVTTMTSAIGALAAANGPVTIVASDDTRACLGMAEGATDCVTNLTVVDDEARAPEDGLVLLDGRAGDVTVLVTRACYMALRRAVNSGVEYDAILLLEEPDRALTMKDVERALGKPIIATVPVSPMVARAVDAGLLGSRLPMVIKDSLTTALTELGVKMPEPVAL